VTHFEYLIIRRRRSIVMQHERRGVVCGFASSPEVLVGLRSIPRACVIGVTVEIVPL
jgi:hypothetical protein